MKQSLMSFGFLRQASGIQHITCAKARVSQDVKGTEPAGMPWQTQPV